MKKGKRSLALVSVLAMIVSVLGGITGSQLNVRAESYNISNPRITKDGVTWDKIQFGSYLQSLKSFDKKPIKWRILSVSDDGTDAFVISDEILDCHSCKYRENTEKNWANSEIRTWMNNTFFSEAFTKSEQNAIKTIQIANGHLNENRTEEINDNDDTEDKIFLLSYNEATDRSYGFTNNYMTAAAQVTDYAFSEGVDRSEKSDYWGNGFWNLRTYRLDSFDGSDDDCWEMQSIGIELVDLYADTDPIDPYIEVGNASWFSGIRPAMHVDLTSNMVMTAGEVDAYGNKTNLNDGYNDPKIDSEGNAVWDCIYFGNYKQYGEYVNEPVEWRVLAVDGNDAFLLADKVIESRLYNELSDPVTWETTPVRKWLNDDFYMTAFSDEERKAIKETDVITEDNPKYKTSGGEPTKDKLFLLSIVEATNSAYGFDDKYDRSDDARKTKVSDYAFARGAHRDWNNDPNSQEQYVDNGLWLLRNAGEYESYVVTSDEEINISGSVGPRNGVRPAMHIDLSKADVKLSGNVTVQNANSQKLKKLSEKEEKKESENTEAEKKESKPVSAEVTQNEKTQVVAASGTTIIAADEKCTVKVLSDDPSNPTVSYIGMNVKKSTSVTIPDTVTYNNITYSVTSIDNKAFSGNKKLKKLTVGKNVTSIGKDAFKGCKNLKSIVLKTTKLTKKEIGKNAFKGINSKAVIKCPKKQLKNYKKWIKKAGVSSKVRFKKI